MAAGTSSVQQRPTVTYRTLQSLRAGEDGVNIMGVVTAFTAPTKTKGPDYHCRVRLADKTSPTMTCNLFNPNSDKLPQGDQCGVGYVICLRGIKISSFQQRTQGLLVSKSPGMWVTFARPRQQSGGGAGKERGHGVQGRFAMAFTPGRAFHPSSEEERMVADLLEWAEDNEDTLGVEAGRRRAVPTRDPTSSKSPVKLGGVKLGMDSELTICGVVKHVKPTTRAKSGGYFTSIVITDETAPREGFTMVLFGVTEDDLPKVYGKGDVVLVRGLKIEKFQGALKGQGREGGHTAVVFSGHPQAGLEPRATSGTGGFSPSPAEKERVRELRSWALEQPGLRLEEHSQTLEDITLGENFDLTCQVIATAFNDLRQRAILTVWDGTETSVPCTKTENLDPSYEVKASEDLTKVAGSFAREVVVYAADKVRAQPGEFVRLLHVSAEPSALGALPFSEHPTVQLHIAKDSYVGGGVVVLKGDDAELLDLKKRLPTTAAEVHIPELRKLKRPLPASVTTVLEPTAKKRATVCTICECSDIPEHFVSQVRVKRVTPACVEDLCKLRCPSCYRRFPHETVGTACPRCTSSKPDDPPPTLQYIYSFSLQVEDTTGLMEVFVSSKDADKFFPQVPPSDLSSDSQKQEALLSRLYYLTGGNNPFQDAHGEVDWPRPWMECGIMTYKTFNNQVRYRICDTEVNEWDL